MVYNKGKGKKKKGKKKKEKTTSKQFNKKQVLFALKVLKTRKHGLKKNPPATSELPLCSTECPHFPKSSMS